MRLIWFAILAAMTLFATAAWADSGISTDPFGGRGPAVSEGEEPFMPEAPWTPGDSAWEEYFVKQVDVSGFMQRLKVVLTSDKYLGGHADVKEVADLMDAMGYFDFTGGYAEFAATGDSIKFRAMDTFNHSDDTFLSRMLSIPDAPLHSAKYVSQGDYMLYVALGNVIDKAMTVMSLPELLNGEGMDSSEVMNDLDLGQLTQGLAMVKALKLDEILGSTLSGEIALVVYDAPDISKLQSGDIQPEDVHAALMVGIKDPEYIMNMANQFGPDIGLTPVEGAPEGWHAFTMMGQNSVGFAFNDEMLIASPNFQETWAHVNKALAGGGMSLDPCLAHVDVDVEKLHAQVIHPLALMGISEMGLEPSDLPSDAMAYLLNVPDPSALGHITATVQHPDGNCYVQCEMKKAVLQWAGFYLGIGLCGAGQAGMLH